MSTENTVVNATFDVWREAGPLRRWRDKNKKSQMDVAVGIGVSLGIIVDWEAGRYWPQWGSIVLLARLMEREPAGLEHALRKWWLQNPTRVGEEVTA